MLISARQAATLLEEAGLVRRQARRVLAAGFAGNPQITSSAHYYELERVAELAARPRLTDAELQDIFGREVFIARREVQLTSAPEVQLAAVRDGWDLSPPTRALLHIRIDQHGYVPLLTTVAGFVALSAEITAVRGGGRYGAALVLQDPGPWFEQVRGRRLVGGPGRDFIILGGRVLTHRTGLPSRPGAG